MSATEKVTEKREVSGFDRVYVRDIGEVILTQGEKESLVVEADSDLISKVKTEVRGGVLNLEVGRGWLDKLTLGLSELSGKRVKYYLTVREINELKISGKGDIAAEKIDSDRLSVGISGLGNVNIDSLNTGKLSVSISGRGEFASAGSVVHQMVNISGSGEYKAIDLESQSTIVKISGQGNASVWANEELEANISGFGKVEYRGSPTVSHSISGLGSVRQLKKS
ncbi:MAG: head GIN domain-containing protein [Candidatus Promineifilaceae bacterium]